MIVQWYDKTTEMWIDCDHADTIERAKIAHGGKPNRWRVKP